MTQPTDPTTAALQQVLAAQHGAVFSYPVIGVELAGDAETARARSLEADHRLARDNVSAELVARGATPVASEPDYAPATPVTDAADARQWALELEQRCADSYRYLLVTTVQRSESEPRGSATASDSAPSDSAPSDSAPSQPAESSTALRQQAMAGLRDAALNSTYWRMLISPDTPTVAFPGI